MNERTPEATAVVERSEPVAPPHASADAANGANAPVVPVPVPAHLQQPRSAAPAEPLAKPGPQEQQRPNESAPSLDQQNDMRAEPGAAPRGWLRRLLGAICPDKGSPRGLQRGLELSELGAEGEPGALVVLLDFVVRVVNRPFAFLSPGARHAIGLAAIATLAIAAVTAALTPLMPRNDPIAFVHEKRAALDRTAAPPAPAEPAKATETGGHGTTH